MQSITERLDKPKNQYSLCILLLIEYSSTGVTMIDAMKGYLFHKFQSRLGEIERSHDSEGNPRSLTLKIRRLPITQKNRFGHTMTFTNYKSLAAKSYLMHLYNKLNKSSLHGNK